MANNNIWWLMIGCGAITFAIRYSFIAAEGHYTPPSWFRYLMPAVPVVALTALTVPDLLLHAGVVDLHLTNPRFWAGLIAIAVAARWKNTLLTIFSGFVVLVALRWLIG
jgi:branched-subunit amino acid transport protein